MKNRLLPFRVDFRVLMGFALLCIVFSAVSGALPKKVIKYGMDMQVVIEVEIKDAKATIDFWIREFFDGSEYDCETFLYKDSSRFLEDFKTGKIDVATSTSLNYFRLRDYMDPDVAFVPVQAGKKTVQYLLLARSDVNLNRIRALKGKQLSMKKNDDIGMLFLETWLLENRIPDIKGFFDGITEKKQHSQAILSVFFGKSDICVAQKSTFDTMVDLNPQVGRELKAVGISPELVSIVVFFHKDSRKELKTIFKNTINNILQDPRGRQFLVIFKLENLTELQPDDMDSLKKMIEKNRELKRKFEKGTLY